jgi:MFS family permease
VAVAETTTQTRQAGDLRNYILVTAAYWADTITDGAIRMLVLFYFFNLGYTPFQVAMLFIFYEIFGVITNLVGGYLGARLGLKSTLFMGLGTQLVALSMLAFAPQTWLVVPYVMIAQAFSGIAKDLTKMSSKSAVKLVVPEDAPGTLYKWVAILTGSKNALKGVGFFIGGLLLTLLGFSTALLILAGLVLTTLITTAVLMKGDLGKADKKAQFRQMFSKNQAVNMLSAARVFLFGSRDVWFVVGLPVFLYEVVGWNFWQVGGFLAVWVIGYGIVQASAPRLVRRRGAGPISEPDGRTATWLAFVLAVFPAGIALALMRGTDPSTLTIPRLIEDGTFTIVIPGFDPTIVVVAGLIVFGIIFALNSAVHSYLILAYTDSNKVAMNVGFYYMANAFGRLTGTVLSGWLYQMYGLIGCLWAAVAFVLATGLISLLLPTQTAPHPRIHPVSVENPAETAPRPRIHPVSVEKE